MMIGPFDHNNGQFKPTLSDSDRNGTKKTLAKRIINASLTLTFNASQTRGVGAM